MTSEELVAVAQSWIGTPYHHQASAKGVGCDCLGLLRGVYAEVYGMPAEPPPAYSRDLAEATGIETLIEAAHRHLVEIASAEGLAPACVVIFRLRPECAAKHCAIVTSVNADGTGRMIHAFEGGPVSEVSLSHWWRRRIAAVFTWPRMK